MCTSALKLFYLPSDLPSLRTRRAERLGTGGLGTAWESSKQNPPSLLQVASHPAVLVLSCSQVNFLGLKHLDLGTAFPTATVVTPSPLSSCKAHSFPHHSPPESLPTPVYSQDVFRGCGSARN